MEQEILKYEYTDKQKEKLIGRQDYFVFPIREAIEWLDKKSKGKFDARNYAPLVYEPIPELERGTIAYDDFWDEQDDRCRNGYAPVVDGIQYPRITGPHYFYLNMYQIMMLRFGERKKRLGYPYYRVLDHMIFLELEKAEKDGYGIIIAKARRMGLSYIGSLMILWNMLFFKDNSVAVGAGIEDKATQLFDKIVKSLDNIRKEYHVSYKRNKTGMRMVYTITKDGVRKDKGLGSTLDVRTFFNNASALEGGSYSFVIFEEIGLHENLIKSYKATEPAFTEGEIQFGVPLLFGTGDNVDKGSRDFKIMWQNSAGYNLKKLFIPKYMYYPGGLDDDDDNANFFDIRTGLNDEKAALEHILKRRLEARKTKEGYIKEVQSNPIKESDVFLKTSGGILDRILLSAQKERIYNGDIRYEVVRGTYVWNDPEDLKPLLARCLNTKEMNLLRINHNVTVSFVEDDDGPVWHLKGVNPINDDKMPYKPDIMGTDSYDEERVVESGSLGAAIVYRTFNGVSRDYDLPVALLLERGDGSSEDAFFEHNLQMAVFWNAENLIEYTKIAILNYYKDVNAYHYLRENPNIDRELVTNRGKQVYGVRMTGGARGFKELVNKLLKIEVKQNVQNIFFDKLIDDLIEYGDANTDMAMALGICLIHKLDIFHYITDDIELDSVNDDSIFDMAYYDVDNDGNINISLYDNEERDIEVFDPRIHLEGEEREKYLNFVQMKRKKEMEEREKQEELFREKEMGLDLFDSQRKQMLKQATDEH